MTDRLSQAQTFSQQTEVQGARHWAVANRIYDAVANPNNVSLVDVVGTVLETLPSLPF